MKKKLKKITYILFLFLITVMFNNCDKGSNNGAKNPFVGSLEGGSSEGGVLFADVLPIFEERCMRCHSSQKPDWTNYEDAFTYVQSGLLKKRAVIDKNMPQSGSPEATAMTDSERGLIDEWINNGGKLNAEDEGVAPGIGDIVADPSLWDVANKCAGCHGDQNPNSDLSIPLLSGQNKDYMVEQLMSFKEGRRTSTVMEDIAKNLTPEEIDFVTLIYSSIKLNRPQAPPPTETPEYIPTLVQACGICHQISSGQNMVPNYPKIAGQNKDYLLNQLLNFKSGARTDYLSYNKIMNSFGEYYDEKTLEELADYISQMRLDE